MAAEIEYAVDHGSTTSEKTNEDYLWIGPEDGVNAVLILDGTSGSDRDFGANGKTGGRRYIETFAGKVREELSANPDKSLREVIRSAIEACWNEFEEEGQEAVREHIKQEDSGEDLPRSRTVPGAVGTLIRRNEEEIELIHIGDIEAGIYGEIKAELRNEKMEELYHLYEKEIARKNGQKTSDLDKKVSMHREAANLPGTYPYLMFNPLPADKLGEKVKYGREKVEKVLLSTDGAAPRMRKLLDLEENEEVIEHIEEKGAEQSLEILRKKENKADLNTLKSSDDAAIALLDFK